MSFPIALTRHTLAFRVVLSTCDVFPSLDLTSSVCRPTVALVYGALGCMTISGLREDVVVCVVLMLESNRAEYNTVRLHTGATPVWERAHTHTHTHTHKKKPTSLYPSSMNICTVHHQTATILVWKVCVCNKCPWKFEQDLFVHVFKWFQLYLKYPCNPLVSQTFRIFW